MIQENETTLKTKISRNSEYIFQIIMMIILHQCSNEVLVKDSIEGDSMLICLYSYPSKRAFSTPYMYLCPNVHIFTYSNISTMI